MKFWVANIPRMKVIKDAIPYCQRILVYYRNQHIMALDMQGPWE